VRLYWRTVRKYLAEDAPTAYFSRESAEALPHLTYQVSAELATTPAGRHNEVWAIDADAYVVRPGPRIVDGLELLAWIIAGTDGDPPHPHAVTRVN
jgi:ABC-type Fe3+-hydroxamate transport system substrate-binding protein